MTVIEATILKTCEKPVTYLDLEKATAAVVKKNRGGPYYLAIQLSRLVNAGKLHHKYSDFGTRHPVYSVRPLPRGYVAPTRDPDWRKK